MNDIVWEYSLLTILDILKSMSINPPDDFPDWFQNEDPDDDSQ